MATRTELDRAYRATTYRLFLPGGALDLRIDQAHPGFEAWLRDNGISQWGIVTAANPRSRPLNNRTNAERQASLECALLEAGYEPFVVENLADDPGWPVEESCFVPGIPEEELLALALEYDQNAVLLGGGDGAPRLVWVEDAA